MGNAVVRALSSEATASISVNIFLSLEGRWPKANLYSQFCYDILYDILPDEDRDVFVDIKLTHHADQQAAGYCRGDEEEVYIQIARNSCDVPYTHTELARNLAHELIHAYQFITNSPKLESEAYGKENILVEKYWAK